MQTEGPRHGRLKVCGTTRIAGLWPAVSQVSSLLDSLFNLLRQEHVSELSAILFNASSSER